ncbi:hypothetical protein BKA64DRAFT_81579 [Cadophora sp. MPI-SDFR-AT-0126]|nr:hypothetical protein BKA64DRAFT_81579 [Leotiomycetes sp. MPI-SDFR-AT-0126]
MRGHEDRLLSKQPIKLTDNHNNSSAVQQRLSISFSSHLAFTPDQPKEANAFLKLLPCLRLAALIPQASASSLLPPALHLPTRTLLAARRFHKSLTKFPFRSSRLPSAHRQTYRVHANGQRGEKGRGRGRGRGEETDQSRPGQGKGSQATFLHSLRAAFFIIFIPACKLLLILTLLWC